MWRMFTLLCIIKIHFAQCWIMQKTFGNAAKEVLKRTTHWAAFYFTNPMSWYPVPERAMFLSAMPVILPLSAVPMTLRACKFWGTGHKRLVLQCVSALSDKRQEWQEPAPCLPTSTRKRCDRVSQSPLDAPGNNGETKPKKQTRKTAYWSTIKAVAKIWMTSHFPLKTTRPTLMLVEFRRWIAREHFCLKRFYVSEELFVSIAKL